MIESKKQYVVVADGDTYRFDADDWTANKDEFMKDFPSAEIAEVDAYRVEDSGDNDNIFATTEDGTYSFSREDWEKNQDEFMKDFPTAQVSRIRGVDYYYDQALELEEGIKAKDEQIKAWQESKDEQTGGADWATLMAQQAGLSPVGAGFDPERDEAVATYVAQGQALQDERKQLQEAYDNNPRVKAAREEWEKTAEEEFARYQREYLGSLRDQIASDMESDVDVLAASRGKLASQDEAFALFNNDTQNFVEKEKLERYQSALNFLDEAEKSRAGKLKGFWTGMGSVAEHVFDEAASQKDIATYADIFTIMQKLEDKYGTLKDVSDEQIDRSLDPSEKALLKAYFEYADATSQDSGDWKYKAGNIAGEGVKFAIEFAMTGGAASGASKGMTKGVVAGLERWAAKALAGTFKAGARNLLAKAGTMATQGLANAVIATALRPSTYTHMAQSSVTIDENGHLNPGKEMTLSFVDDTIETISEMSGGLISKVLDVPFKPVKGLMGKAWNKAFGNTKFGEWAKVLADGPIMDYLKQGGFDGLPSEILEEYVGNTMRLPMNPDALKEMHGDGNWLSMVLGFLPMSVLGGGVNMASFGFAQKKAKDSAAALQQILVGKDYEKGRSQYLTDYKREMSPYELGVEMFQLEQEMKQKGASEEELQALADYTTAVVEYQTLRGGMKEMQRKERDQVMKEHENQYGTFYHEDAEGKRSVSNAVTNDGRQVFIVGSENGQVAAIDKQSGKNIVLNESDIRLREDVSMDSYLDSVLQGRRQLAQTERMDRERNEQIAKLNDLLPKTLNLGTQGEPQNVAVKDKSQRGVTAVDEEGNEIALTWDQVGRAMGMPIKVLTDAQIAEAEAAAIGLGRQERKAQRASSQAEADSIAKQSESLAQQVKEVTPKPEEAYRDQETGEIDENAFWENDPEGYCDWNDREMQDNGADSLEQIESGMNAIAKRMAELDKMASDSPNARKAIKAEKTQLQEKMNRLTALQQKYTQASISEEQQKAEQTLQYREKIEQWRKQFGVPIHVYDSIEEVKDKSAVKQIGLGTTPGWQNASGVHIYLPHVDSMETLEETLKHEITGHEGFALLGEEAYNELMDKIWAMMSDSARNTFFNYAGVSNLEGDLRRRKAAEEFASHVAEKVRNEQANAEQKSIWERIVDFFRRLFNDENLDANLIADAIRKNYEALQQKAAEKQVEEFKGTAQEQANEQIVPEVAETNVRQANGTNNYSTATYHSWVDNLGHEHQGTREQVIERMQKMGFSETEIEDMTQRMDTAYAYMEKLRRLTNPDGTVRFDEFNKWAEKTPLYKQVGRNYVKAITSLVSNGDYPVNLEITTDCIKREAFTQLLNELVKRGAELSGMGPGEIVTIQKMMKQYGIEVACNLCFVEGKRLQIVNWASQIVNDWNDALVEAGVDTDEYFEFGKDGDAFIPADEWRTYEDKSKVAKVMRNLDDIALLFQGIDPKTFKAQKRKNKKALDKYIKEKAEKAKKPVDKWKPNDDQKREMKKIANEGLYPTYVNENMQEYKNAFNAMRNEWLSKNPNADPLSFTPNSEQWGALKKIRNRQIDNVRAKMVRLIMEYPEMRKKMTLNDLLGSKGLMEIRQQHGQAYEDLYSIILQRFGTGTPKPVQDAVPYDGEVMTLTESAFKKANEIGGARLFSFSDFDITKVFDYMQMFFDLEANKQMLQSYTKEVAAVLIFGRSNAKFNISTLANAIVPDEVKAEYEKASDEQKKDLRHKWAEYAGLQIDAEGNIIGINFSEEHSVSPAFAQQIFHDDSRNKDCGAIMVGASVNHAIFSAAQQWIRMVIPFHLSGMPLAAREKTDVKWYTDNTAYQSTRKKTKDGWSKISDSEDTFKFYNDMSREGWNMRDKTREYLAWCAEKGFRPKFDWGINSDHYRAYCEENGYTPNQQIIDMMDADTTDGVWNQYYKFLTDFTAYKPVFNEQGEMIDEIPSPQLPVQSNFDFSEMERGVLFEGERSMLEHREGNIQRTNRHIEILAEQATAYLNGDVNEEEMGLRDDVHFENTADAERYLEEVAKENGTNMFKTEVDNLRAKTLSDINSQFNAELQQQIDGTLPSGHVYQLGLPSNKLLGAGIDNLPIELAASRLVDKSMQENHPYSLSDVENLPVAIQKPLAVFISATHIGSHVILTELTAKGKNFVAALRVMPNKNKITVNQIRSLYPKSTMAIVDWISDELGTTFDRMKMLDWLETKKSEMLSKPQSNSVEVRKQFASATKVVKEFVNPTIPTTNMYKTRTDSQREKLFADAKERFGVTDNFKVAGYMLPDGSLLDFSEANDGGDPNQRSLDHRSIEDVIMEDGTEYDSRWMYLADFMNEGAIRLLPEYAGINLMKAPTKEQRQRLMDFIYKYNGEVILEIADERLNNAAYVEYDRRTSPARIFRDIDGYFNEGIVPQSNTMFKTANKNQAIFVSNAVKAVEGIKMEKATPEQWLKMIEKNGGLKAGEDKWMGLSDFLKSSDKKTLTKQEVLDFVNEHMIQIEEQHYGTNLMEDREDALHDNMIKNYGQDFYDRFVGDAFIFEDSLYGGDWHLSIQFEDTAAELYNEYNEDKVDYNEDEGGLSIQDKEKVRKWATAVAREMEAVGGVRQINPTRKKYTTGGLKNKHEIALTVPTIESWNKGDDVHFGDAGEGRAVAWIRFGDGVALMHTEASKELHNEVKAHLAQLREKYGEDSASWSEEERGQLFDLIDATRKAKRESKVLVIDEIQSQRHQDAKDVGYRTKADEKQRKEQIKAVSEKQNVLIDYIGTLVQKYPNTDYDIENVFKNFGAFSVEEREELKRLKEEYDAAYAKTIEIGKGLEERIPEAPFEKNWAELAMKRMLRYAAENGYDAIAWTEGEQQVRRYQSLYDYESISVGKWKTYDGAKKRSVDVLFKDGTPLNFGIDEKGKITRGRYKGEKLTSVLSKEVSKKIMAAEGEVVLTGEDLTFGEGMKHFYDKMLPSFMNKYGKKWGVSVDSVYLKDLGMGLNMHSVPVTEEMKESVMEGQTMFKTRQPNQTAESFYLESMRNYVKKYGSRTIINVMPLNEETAKKVGHTLEELQYVYGEYLGKDGIAIFAREDVTESDDVDIVIYHETIHHLANKYPELVQTGKMFWEWADHNRTLAFLKSEIEEKYPNNSLEKNYEEMLCYSMELYAQEGELERLISILDGQDKKNVESIVSKTKYGKQTTRTESDSATAKAPGVHSEENRRGSKGSADEDGKAGAGNLYRTEISPEVRREMDVISAQAIVNGNYMKAPNGKDSKLTPEQWAMVRTKNFKQWFGNWENDPENASKVVDPETGEPMVVYHGTAGVINKFEDQQRSPGFWFVNREDVANGYAESASAEFGEEKNVIPVFLNIRKPRVEDAHAEYPAEFALKSYVENDNGVYEVFDTYEEAEAYREANVPDGWVGAAEVGDQHDLVERAKELGHDGVVMMNMHDQAAYAETGVKGTQTNYVVLDANQIKSATDNTGEFSESEDIRFKTYAKKDLNDSNIATALSELYDDFKHMENDIYGTEELVSWIGRIVGNYDGKYVADLQDIIDTYEEDTREFGRDFDEYGGRMVDTEDRDAKVSSALSSLIATISEAETMESKEPSKVQRISDAKRREISEKANNLLEEYIKLREETIEQYGKYYEWDAPKEVVQRINKAWAEYSLAAMQLNYPYLYKGEEGATLFKTRTKPAPENTITVYKMVRLGEDGQPYPLFIDSAEPMPVKTWLDADSPNLGDLKKLPSGVHLINTKTGESMTLAEFEEAHPEMKNNSKKATNPTTEAINWATMNGMRFIKIVDKKTKQTRYSGEKRAYYNLGIDGGGSVSMYGMRPGWHAGSHPVMRQIGNGPEKNLRADNHVWVRGRISADVDYQAEANANPGNDIPTHIPTDGYYLKATNANAKASQADRMGWYISGSFIIDEFISDAEARRVIDVWNADHPDKKLEYDFPRESGREYDPKRGGLVEKEGTTMFKTEPLDTATMDVDELVEQGRMKVASEGKAAADERMRKIRSINGDLNSLRSAVAAQREYDKNTVQILARLANDMLEGGKMSDATSYEIKRLVGAIASATGKKDLTNAVNRLMDVMIANQLRHGRENIDAFLRIRGKKVDAKGVEVQGKLDIVGQQIMDAIRDNIESDLVDILFRMIDVEENLTSDSETIRRNAENELIGLQFAKRYVEEIKQSEKEEKDLRKEIKVAETEYKAGKRDRKSYRDFVKVTNEAIRENRMQRVLAYQKLVDDLAKMVTKSIQGADLLRQSEKDRVAQIQHYANSDMQGMPADTHKQKEGGFWNNGLVRLFTSPLATFEQWLRVFGAKSAEGKGYLYNHFMGAWSKATDQEYLGMKEAHAILDAKAREVFGGKVTRWSDIFSIEKKMPKHTIQMWDDGEMKDYEITQGQLLYIYMVNKMIDGKMKLRRMGISEEDVDEIKNALDPRFIALADWIQDEFLPSLRDKYNAVHERLFGAPMAAIESYFPIKVNANARVRDVDLGAPETSAKPSTITGSIIKRTKNGLALDILNSDAFDVVLEHIEQMEHWAAFAEFNRDLNTLLSYRKFRNRVQNMSTALGSGKEAWNSFRETAEIAAGVYQPKTAKADKLLTNAVKGLTAGKISFRLWTALKQMLSMPAFFPYVNPAKMVYCLTTPWEAWNWAMENLPAFEKRWKSREAGNVRLKKTEADSKIWQGDWMEIATRFGMTPNAFVDAVTCAIGSYAVYLTQMEKYNAKYGYQEGKAREKARLDAMVAFNATQQSSESAFLSTVQSDRTFIAHALTVFRNNSFGMQRELVDALRNFKKRMKSGYKAESIEFMKKQMVRDGLTEGQAERAAKRIYRNSAFKDAARIATFGFLMQFLWNLGGSAIYLLFGDDDEEKEQMIKDAAIRGAFGSIEGLGFGNVITEGMSMAATGDIKRFHPSLSPAGADLETLWNEMMTDPVAGANELINILVQAGLGANPQVLTDAAVAIYDACDGDIQTSKEVGLAILRILQVPQSQIDKLKTDEIDFTNDRGLDLTIEDFAKEYAEYKKLRNAPLTHALYSEEADKKVEDKYIKRFLKDAEALKRTRGNEEAKAYYQYLDTEYKEIETTLRELNREIKEAEQSGNKGLAKAIKREKKAVEKSFEYDVFEAAKKAEAAKRARDNGKDKDYQKNDQKWLEERRQALKEIYKLGSRE